MIREEIFDIIYNLSKNFKINVYDPYINKKMCHQKVLA